MTGTEQTGISWDQDNQAVARLEAFIAQAAGVPARILAIRRLEGMALGERWQVEVCLGDSPAQAVILGAGGGAGGPEVLDAAEEFAVLHAAAQAGVAVPEPLWLCEDAEVIGRRFFLVRQAEGVDDPGLLTSGGERPLLVEGLARELARIHAIHPPREDLAFLAPPPATGVATQAIGRCRAWLDAEPIAHPVLEYGLRWAERHVPAPGEVVLCHGDFRTGNFVIGPDGGIAVIRCWHFARWGDPAEDIAWFGARYWRFLSPHRGAGGLAGRELFLRAYESFSGRRLDAAALHFWEVMANLRWACLALQQAARHLSGREFSLDLALAGRRPAEIELDILTLIEGS